MTIGEIFACVVVFVVIAAGGACIAQCQAHIDGSKDRRECRKAGGRPTGEDDSWYCAKTPDVQPFDGARR